MWNWYSQHLLLGNSDIFHSLASNYKLQHIAASYASYKKCFWEWFSRNIKNEKIVLKSHIIENKSIW